jgi:putative SOS response-associated peptidase YedK
LVIKSSHTPLLVQSVQGAVGLGAFLGEGKRPDPINARIETVMTGRFFKELRPNGRALAPANGWFEWVKDPDDPKKKLPYFIRLKDESPMFFAALGQVRPGLEPDERDGMVIITAASDAGMVDIHDRRPLVLAPKHAREWVDPETSAKRAAEIAKECCRPTADCTWYEVSKDVGNVRNQGPVLIDRKDE